MAGRGRGRGRGQVTFNMEAVGIGKGDVLPPPTLQPTPLFPVRPQRVNHCPVSLGTSQCRCRSLRGAMRSLPYFVKPAAPKKDVERYSDKYQSSEPTDNTIEWNPDWRRLPREMRIRVRKPLKENANCPLTRISLLLSLFLSFLGWTQTLEKKEEEVSSEEEEEEKKKKQEEEEQENEEEYDEEEFEEETDYIMSYFDNGEEFGGDSDDNMDEAIY
ncbi:DNA-directed RNA polymerase III subunit RPC7-like [Huso huso]|uniref:DNA-directed RNA polymerase III subunit RPC7-like n=1 Tax=Huso huso TaxID=61971 RepID=A0ABR0Y3F6_HUSHU